MIERKKLVLIIFRALVFIMVFGLVFFVFFYERLFVFFYGREPEINLFVSGEAEAVATTLVTVENGLWDERRFLDELYFPVGIALMGESLVVADSMADRIQILDGGSNHRIGRPGVFGFAYYDSGALIDGYRENAMFMNPAGVSLSSDGEFIIVSDTGNSVIRRICEDFVITIAGNGFAGFADGHEGLAQFNRPRAAVACPLGYIYVADTMNHVLRRIDPEGNVTLFSGTAGTSGFIDGDLMSAQFFEPSGLYLSDDGVLYVADAANHAIRRIENGTVTTVAGRPGEFDRFTGYYEGAYVDGANSEARFNFPRDIAVLPNGYIFVADSLNHAVRLITPQYTRTIIGSGQAGSFSASAENLSLSRPEGVAANEDYLFVSDSINNRVITIELSERVMAGRPSREEMLANSGLTINSRFPYRGDIRVFLGGDRVDMGRVQPWNTAEAIYIPIRPFLEALGAGVELNERAGTLHITIADTVTTLVRDSDYFILRGVMVTTLDEIIRLFPYPLEWFPELSLITISIPFDLE